MRKRRVDGPRPLHSKARGVEYWRRSPGHELGYDSEYILVLYGNKIDRNGASGARI
jgi:hypothetical protein